MTPTTEKCLNNLTLCLILLRVIEKVVSTLKENESAESSSSPTTPENDNESTNVESTGVGLGIVEALVGEDKDNSEDITVANTESPRVLLGVQVKGDTLSTSETQGPTTNSQDGTLESPIVMISNMTPREIMMSEEYTRITYRGPNPRVVHMYKDVIIHNSFFEDVSSDPLYEEQEEEEGGAGEEESFEIFCHFCRKKISCPEDVFMWR